MELVRAGHSGAETDLLADVHVFETTEDVGPDGGFVLLHHGLVSFRFGGIDQLRIEGWNHQNVLMDLQIKDVRSRQLDGLFYEICFDGSVGVHAEFLCRSVEIESVRPWQE